MKGKKRKTAKEIVVVVIATREGGSNKCNEVGNETPLHVCKATGSQ
jgi:hypothetical protein